uniref:Zinc finger protein 740 isoform X2 n=1 Tax=Geotrypetes seraphini TaxID=260995 RepID=A0A6P8QWU5_GEOSA|nr:zinc finger protein 740 isoform X2 [Geotrypetes seraphini]
MAHLHNSKNLHKEKEKSGKHKEKEDNGLPQPKKSHKKVVVIEQNGSFQMTIPKNFICEHCYGAFRSSYHLKRHIYIHTGEKPFQCDVCDMRFIQKYHLERHKRVHSGEKPYHCERCQQVISFDVTIEFLLEAEEDAVTCPRSQGASLERC